MLLPVRTVPPAELPVSIDEARLHLRVDHTDEDTLIEGLIFAATEALQEETRRAFITQTWRVDFCGFYEPLKLPYAPVQSITSVQYFDATNASATVASSNYALVPDALGPRVDVVYGATWPSSVYSRPDAVRVTFVAGYGGPQDVPPPLRAALLLMIGDLYAYRETVAVGVSATEIPMSATVKALVSAYRRY